ncbi:MAG TPA: AsnC family transcriptional regulator, partial [Verrucomicrobiota bacterium]|nr:AsnC family transcriptional regulator [Verrucomicrobiota bacterium]
MANSPLDELDRQLIEQLARDARVSNRKIAAALGVTEGTVRGRIKRLQQDGLIAFTAITGLEMAAKSRLAFISVHADVNNVRAI